MASTDHGSGHSLRPARGAEKDRRSKYLIQRVAVLGAGTMGARIAAHIANAGLQVLLLDLPSTDTSDKSHLVLQAIENLKKAKPAAFTDQRFAARIAAGNFEEDLNKLQDCDWILEAVAENLEIKRSLLQKIAPHLRPDAIVTTNTSGLPVGLIAQGMPEEFRRHWFGTHFFNPPRYMRLVELIATPESDRDAIAEVAGFAEIHLGKTVVAAHDTPNFIANRLGTFAMLNTFRVMQQMGLSVEEVDALTGSAIGWPKTGTFRLADMVGIDVLASVALNFEKNVRDERADVTLPNSIEQMLERKWLGDKAGQGFYKKQRGQDGKEARFVLDPATLEYKPSVRPKIPELEMAKSNEVVAERIRALLAGNPERDKAARFYWQVLPELWAYAANRIGEIADTIVDIDRAMKAGFNWELGPFEMWDAAGLSRIAEYMRSRGQNVPLAVEKLMAAGGTSWYRQGGREFFDPVSGTYLSVPRSSSLGSLASIKQSTGVVEKSAGASLIDLGDGVACIEFHSKMNTIGEDIVKFMLRVLRSGSEAVRNFEAFVVTNDALNFSVGANLMHVLLAIQDEEWDELDASVRGFQGMTHAIKFCARPVIVAPFGMCLGGGAEIALHAAARQPHVELYMGLVETGVGLLPAGGGCKEMTLRAVHAASEVRADLRGESVEVNETIKNVFETVAMAKVSTSAVEASRLRFLRESDGITMNRELVVEEAKSAARRLADAGYLPPVPRADIPAPGESVLATLRLGVHMMREAEFISDHDAKVARKVANVLCGGSVTPGTPVSEQYLLDLEREGFLSLCGEPKTVERIGFTLKNGKPLRN
ncbi:MAG TPA: 3-hydroxyacyl-CoA dehydrogenase NAD-binding domain-containing protein [Acidobacteriaceae bacterium]|nr:3-hydroxyacyl-CoA dehydrogenase NAD-binding domain-containing protein [Acidobacteriaceae bacterium]